MRRRVSLRHDEGGRVRLRAKGSLVYLDSRTGRVDLRGTRGATTVYAHLDRAACVALRDELETLLVALPSNS